MRQDLLPLFVWMVAKASVKKSLKPIKSAEVWDVCVVSIETFQHAHKAVRSNLSQSIQPFSTLSKCLTCIQNAEPPLIMESQINRSENGAL